MVVVLYISSLFARIHAWTQRNRSTGCRCRASTLNPAQVVGEPAVLCGNSLGGVAVRLTPSTLHPKPYTLTPEILKPQTLNPNPKPQTLNPISKLYTPNPKP